MNTQPPSSNNQNQQHDNAASTSTKRVFSQEAFEPQDEATERLSPKQTFNEQEAFTEQSLSLVELDKNTNDETSLNIDWLDESSVKTNSPWGFWLLIALLCVSAVQVLVWLWQAFTSSPALAGAWLVVISGCVLWGVTIAVKEWRSLRNLRHQAQCQRDAERLLNSVQQGEAQSFCLAIANNLPKQDAIQNAVTQWRQSIQAHHQDKEILALFEQTVMAQCDKFAEQAIKQHATQTALLVAVSPLALMDVFIVFFRSIRLTQQVSRCYGIQHGYWSRIRLIRQTLHQMLYVATSELLIDVAGSVLGFELLGKISARAVQGVGAGLMAGRLGYNAQKLVRPLPKAKLVENGTRKLGKQLIDTLMQQVKSSKSNQ